MSWYVRNVRDMKWWDVGPRGFVTELVDNEKPQVGVNLFVLAPGQPMAMYHWEADQEGFLVLSGEALLIVEGKERGLRQWDFFHCPAGTNHITIGAGTGPCAVLAIGAREHQGGANWGAYTVDDKALRHRAGVREETTDPTVAYARFPKRELGPYREGWLASR